MGASRQRQGRAFLLAAVLLCAAASLPAVADTAAAWLGVANRYAAAGQYAAALQSYQIAAAIDPSLADAHYGIGWAQFHLQRYTEAETALRTALRVRPGHRAATYTLGEVLLERGRGSAAEEIFRRLVRQSPEDYAAKVGLARALLIQGRHREARPHVETAVRLRPDLPRPRMLLGQVLRREGDNQQAEAALLAAYSLDPTFEPAQRELVNLYLATQRPESALPLLQALLGRYPREVALLEARVQAYRDLGRGDALLQALEELIAALPAARAVPHRRELAQEHLARGNLALAESQLRQALRAAPRDTASALLLARVLVAQGKTAEASELLGRMPGSEALQAELLASLAEAQLARGQAAESLESASQALELSPGLESALRTAAQAARQLDRLPEALLWARRLVAALPGETEARELLAQILLAAGQPTEAMRHLHLLRGRGSPAGSEALHSLSVLAITLRNPEYQLNLERVLADLESGGFSSSLFDLLLAQNRFEEAEWRLNLALRREADNPDLLAAQARLWRLTGRGQQSGPLLEEALSRHRTHDQLNLERGLWLAAHGEPQIALPLLCRSLLANPLATPAYEALLHTAQRTGEFAPAVDFLTNMVRPEEGQPVPIASPVILRHLARLWEARSGPEEAARQLGELSDGEPGRADLALAAARQYEVAERRVQAGRYYERAGLHPQYAEAALRLAVMNYSLAGETARLLETAMTYLGRAASDPAAIALLAEMQSAEEYLTPEGLGAVVGLVGATPGSFEYHRHRTELYRLLDRLEELESLWVGRAALAGSGEERLPLALAQYRAGRLPEALRTLAALPAKRLAEPPVVLLRAELLEQTGEPEAALQLLDGLRSPGDAQLAALRARLLHDQGRHEEALAEWARSLAAGAPTAEVFGSLEGMLEAGEVSVRLLLAGLAEAYAGAADPRPLRRFVVERLPQEDPAVEAWLAAHPPLALPARRPRPGGPGLAPVPVEEPEPIALPAPAPIVPAPEPIPEPEPLPEPVVPEPIVPAVPEPAAAELPEPEPAPTEIVPRAPMLTPLEPPQPVIPPS